MESLLLDLSDDIRVYEKYQIPANTKQQENLDGLLELLAKNQTEGIGEQLALVFQVENYAPTVSTYSSMKSSGQLRLINDLDLQKELNDYYEGVVPESVKKGEFQAEYFTQELLRWLTRNVDLIEMKLTREDDLLTLRNQLIVYESLIEQKIKSYTEVVEESKKLQLSIQSKLNE